MPDDGTLAAEQMPGREIVTTALSLLRANYVFPELAEQAAVAVEARLAAGEYDNLDEITLTDLLTRHLLRGLRGQAPARAARRRSCPAALVPAAPARRPRRPALAAAQNATNQPITRPPARHAPAGTAGQLRHSPGRTAGRQHRLSGYPPGAGACDCRPAITAAMELVAGTYALIIDLRRNGGGSPEGVVFWCSYLFTERPTHLNDIFHADTGETRQFWSLPYVPGPATSTARSTC